MRKKFKNLFLFLYLIFNKYSTLQKKNLFLTFPHKTISKIKILIHPLFTNNKGDDLSIITFILVCRLS